MAIEDGDKNWIFRTSPRKAVSPDHAISTVPPWLIPLLRANYFSPCFDHRGNKNECNLYCLDCAGDALCFRCLPRHRDHRVLQIRRSSYQNVIKASEASQFIDIAGVQTYVINGAKVVFLNERPQMRPSKSAAHACESCCRPLIDSHIFCSIGCKLGATIHNLGAHIALSEETQRSGVLHSPDSGEMVVSGKRSAAALSEDDDGRESSNGRSPAGDAMDGFLQAELVVYSRRRSRRKGIPRRASFC